MIRDINNLKYKILNSIADKTLPYNVSISGNVIYKGIAYPIPGTYIVWIDLHNILMNYIMFNNIDLTANSTINSKENIIDYRLTYNIDDNNIISNDTVILSNIDEYYVNFFQNTTGYMLQQKNTYYMLPGARWVLQILNITDNSISFNTDTIDAKSTYVMINNTESTYTISNKSVSFVKLSCNRYNGMIYFINRYGGWESIPVLSKKNKMKNTYNRSTYTKNNYNNIEDGNQSLLYETNYSIEETTTMTITTDFIDDNDVKYYEQIISSPYVIYYNATTDRYHTALVATNSYEYNYFINNDRNIPVMTFDIQFSKKQKINV